MTTESLLPYGGRPVDVSWVGQPRPLLGEDVMVLTRLETVWTTPRPALASTDRTLPTLSKMPAGAELGLGVGCL
jgi:hypothetical protein